MVARGRGSLAASQQMIRSGTYKTDSRKTKCYGKGSCNTSKRNSVDRRTLPVNTSCGMADQHMPMSVFVSMVRHHLATAEGGSVMHAVQERPAQHLAGPCEARKQRMAGTQREYCAGRKQLGTTARRGISMAKALAGQAGRCMAAALAAACSPAVPLASQAGNGGPQSPLLRIGGHAPRTQALLKNGRWVRCVGFAFAFMLFSTVFSPPQGPSVPQVLAVQPAGYSQPRPTSQLATQRSLTACY